MIVEAIGANGTRRIANVPGGKTLGEILGPHQDSIVAVKINGSFKRQWQSHICGHGNDDRVSIVFKTGTPEFWIGLIISLVLTGISMLLAPKPKKPNFNNRREDSSATAGLHNATETGSPLFYSFGENRIFGTVIGSGSRVAPDGKSMLSRMLYFMGITDGFGIGGIDEIIIDDQPLENHPGIKTEIRLGLSVQDIIADFNNVTQVFTDQRTFTPTQSITYTSRFNNVNELRPTIAFSNFVSANSRGSQRDQMCEIRVESKLTADPPGNFSEVADSPFRFVGRTNSPIYFPIAITVAGVGAGAQYDLRFTKITASTDFNAPPDPVLYNMEEVQWTSLTYPNCALLSLSDIPSADFPSLSNLRVSARVRGNVIPVPDGFGGFTRAWTRERVWIYRYMSTNPEFGCGVGARRQLPPRVMTKDKFPGLIDNPFRLVA